MKIQQLKGEKELHAEEEAEKRRKLEIQLKEAEIAKVHSWKQGGPNAFFSGSRIRLHAPLHRTRSTLKPPFPVGKLGSKPTVSMWG